MASVRFLGREIAIGSDKPEDRQRDSQQGQIINEMVDAALPGAIAHFNQLQQAKAAQAKQYRDEARAIAKQFNIIVEERP
jgi:hypothetical protein